MSKLKPHPLAELLPMMSESDYQALKADIAANGQRDPILVFQGKILDGRNRYRAVSELGVEPNLQAYTRSHDDAVGLVYSRAIHRNMTDSQKACSALRFLPHFEKLAISRMKTNGVGTSSPGSNGRAKDHAGALFGVSGRYLTDAQVVLEADKKLFQACFEGREFLSRAAREIARRHKARRLTEAVKTIRRNGKTPTDEASVVTGDCLEMMDGLNDSCVRLIITDPPYNIGIDYGNGPGADRISESDYRRLIEGVRDESYRALTKDGSIFIIISGQYLPDFEMILRGSAEVEGFYRRNVIVWHETFGNYTAGNFTDCWRAILYYTKHERKFVWHGDQILIPSDRQAKYADKRANPSGKVPSNVWGEFPRIVDNHRERMPHFPTQIPQALVERIVLVASDPGDLVVDPFTGSGTTGAAAVKHHRKFLGAEIVERNAQFARARIARQIAERRG